MGCITSQDVAPHSAPVQVGVQCGHCHAPFSVVFGSSKEIVATCPQCAASNRFDGAGLTGSTASAAPPMATPVGPPVPEKSVSSLKTAKTMGAKTAERLQIELSTGSVRRPCKYGLNCYRKQGDHLDLFSHPDDDDYVLSIRKYPAGVKAEFLTMKHCFKFMDPFDKGIIDDRALFAELMRLLDKPMSDEEVEEAWDTIDDDGNGFASFTEFAEWAREHGIDLPLGLENPTVEEGADLACTYAGCSCTNFRGAGRICRCGHKRGLHLAKIDHEAGVPEYWTNQDLSEAFNQWIECEADVRMHVQQLMMKSQRQVWTRDRGRDSAGAQKKVPSGFQVVKVQRNENLKIWRKYALKRHLIKENLAKDNGDGTVEHWPVFTYDDEIGAFPGASPLEKSINEWHLWHGTSVEGAKQICEVDFKQRYAGSATGTLYGPGTYFAESCTKADEYAGVVPEDDANAEDPLFIILLCRVVGGRVMYNDEVEPDAEELTNAVLHGDMDSVLGDREKCRNTFKEFVIFGSDQAYPEYIVHYRRKFPGSGDQR